MNWNDSAERAAFRAKVRALIAGGTSEIQRNIISTRGPRLPKG